MKKNLKKALAFGITLMMTMATTMTSAMATMETAEPVTEEAPTGSAPLAEYNTTTNGAKLIKRLLVPDGMTNTPEATFTFTFEPQDVKDSTTPGEKAPDIIGKNASDAQTTNSWQIKFLTNDTLAVDADGTTPLFDNGFRYADKSIEDVLKNMTYTDPGFTHAGIYSYIVTEEDVDADGITYSTAKYHMDVYVANTASSTDPLIIKYVKLVQLADETTTVENPFTAIKVDNMLFKNTYTKNTELEISKKVAGDYANTDKTFGFTVTINAVPGTPQDASYTGVIKHANNSYTDVTITLTGGVGTSDIFYLKDGESILFADASGSEHNGTSLPIGSTYIVTESANDPYSPAVTVARGLDDHTTNHSLREGTRNKPLSAGSGSSVKDTITGSGPDPSKPILLTDMKDSGTRNTADWLNTYENVTPTGILMNNLPFVLLIVVAIGGFVGYIVLKQRKTRN